MGNHEVPGRSQASRKLSGAAARTGDKNAKVIEKNVEMRMFKSAIKRRNINIMIINIEYFDSVDRVDKRDTMHAMMASRQKKDILQQEI